MQPRLKVGILILQAKGVVSLSLPWFPLQTTPAGIVVEPQEVAVLIGHLSRNADLVAVEVVGLLVAFRLWHWCGCVLVPKVRSLSGSV